MEERREPGYDLLARLQALAAFLPIFERPDMELGAWAGGDRLANGSMSMPYYSFGPEAEDFISTANEFGWVIPFDWGAWARTPEGRRLCEGGAAIEGATPEDLARLLTTIIRSERFGDGQLEGAFRSGLLTAIVRRAAALASQESRSPTQRPSR